MLYLSVPCPICNVGRVGFCRCRDSTTIGLMCMDCESMWTDPTQIDALHALFPPHIAQEKDGACVWASQAEVELRGWLDLVAGELVTPGFS